MSRFKLGVVIFILATALSTATYAANKGGGGGGHGGGGGGMAAVVDMRRRWRRRAHAGGGGGHARAAGGGGTRHISGRPAISRSSAAPRSRATRATSSRTNRSTTVKAPANNAVGRTTPLNATGKATRNANVNPNLRSQRRAHHVEGLIGRRRIAQDERITRSEEPLPHHRKRGDGGMARRTRRRQRLVAPR